MTKMKENRKMAKSYKGAFACMCVSVYVSDHVKRGSKREGEREKHRDRDRRRGRVREREKEKIRIMKKKKTTK